MSDIERNSSASSVEEEQIRPMSAWRPRSRLNELDDENDSGNSTNNSPHTSPEEDPRSLVVVRRPVPVGRTIFPENNSGVIILPELAGVDNLAFSPELDFPLYADFDSFDELHGSLV